MSVFFRLSASHTKSALPLGCIPDSRHPHYLVKVGLDKSICYYFNVAFI